ncbi:FecR family protein [uncultured Psychroserpens sp.]|uniref:FecR family protein n=1 Tax=uncultured Psychroserpens sp. TaxID=255436 RepID=UPI00261A3610|nr:FecR family protein [uncultured Psychroserpens sp.]
MNTEDHIKKWLNDELTPAEKEAFEQDEDFALYQAIVGGAKKFKASDFSEPKSFEDFKSAYEAQHSAGKTSNWRSRILRIAGMVVIAIGIYYGVFYKTVAHIETLASEQTTIELPDQSEVTLNAGSVILYDKKDWEDNRRLTLSGEAYFKVAKGKTFDVITSQATVTVVGTEFNVKQRENYFEVQCFEGIVRVTSRAGKTKELLAGDTYRLLDDVYTWGKTTFVEPQWTQNRSTFKAVPFEAVIAEMERQYDIKIIVDNVNTERLFTGGFMHDDIEKALLSVTEPMDLTFKINGSNDVVIHGNKK